MMNLDIIGPPLLAGLLIISTHVPLGREVLSRGIIFIDLAVAQIAALGLVIAFLLGWQLHGWLEQSVAAGSALLGAVILQSMERYWPDVQEALIGVTFVLAATASLLLLAGNPHGAEQLQHLLAGQILWVSMSQLPVVAIVYALILLAWFLVPGFARKKGFYVLFAVAITASVQIVGVFLVFASLILPALAVCKRRDRSGLLPAYGVGALAYLLGLLISFFADLPAGPVIVWMLALLAGFVAVVHAMLEKRS